MIQCEFKFNIKSSTN